MTLADVEAIRKSQSLVEENTALRLESGKLRERLGEVEAGPVKAKHVRGVRRIYKDGFHVCGDWTAPRAGQECMFCDELLYRK